MTKERFEEIRELAARGDHGDELINECLDEIAQLKVALETILYAQLGGHLNPNETGKHCLDKLRLLL